jgi:hypothetical protein
LPWLSNLTKQFKISSGLAYWAISPATRQPELTSAGIPVGLPDAAYLGDDLVPFFLEVSAVPYWVREIPDVQDWQLATLYYLVCCRNLGIISVWSPTFLLTLMDALHNRRNELGTALTNGLKIHRQELPANPVAYKKLLEYYVLRDVKALWPELKVISCWADASSMPFFVMIKKLFAGVSIQPKGLLLTEGVVTMPNDKNQTVITADSGFYEFMDEDDNLKLAHQLETDEKYRVVMTTSGGLYRYQTYDWVKCDGYASDLPILRFIGRDSSCDMVGEKLTEVFVTACLKDISGFRMLLPVSNHIPGYLLILDNQPDVEALVNGVETRLSDNPQYAYARKIGQLRPLTAIRLNNPLEIYLNSPLHAGTRLGDIKVPSLCVKKSVFDEHIGSAA